MSLPNRLRALLAEPGFVVMPAVWDGLSAKLSAAAGFKTAFMSGSCVAASRLGGPDLDLISFGEMFDSFNMIRGAAPDTLVLADGDHGYGNAMNVQRTVRAYGRAGAAAILIEDKITPRALTAAGKPCLPREEARMKIRAAVEAAKESGILILARTDCRPTQGIDEAVARIEMYVEEGADILFLDRPTMTPKYAAPCRRHPAGPRSRCCHPARRGPRPPAPRRRNSASRSAPTQPGCCRRRRQGSRRGLPHSPPDRPKPAAQCRRRNCAPRWDIPPTTPRPSRSSSPADNRKRPIARPIQTVIARLQNPDDNADAVQAWAAAGMRPAGMPSGSNR